MPRPPYDCRVCGACCVNLPSNQAESFASWVEIEDCDRILEHADLVRKLVVLDDGGVPHLRLVGGGRCAALSGAPGRRVSCRIYGVRPSPCRRVQPGDALCERYRAEHGLAGPRPVAHGGKVPQ
ncbi:MAG TPA: YkgJ family cysteine cluster protein [Kofleriaceae bacterium]|nr:YkgJ family cysteine cluster protein [Kofleriaceae bacterium]